MGITGLAVLPLTAGPTVSVQVGVPVPPPPVVVVTPPPPPPPVVVMPVYPESYVWDGYEYVGVVGTQYYYLGPDKVWLTLDVDRQARFHEWEKVHADWRDHAIHNDIYRGRSPDTHKVDGRSPDGQKVDGRSPDTHKVDGRSPDAQKTDGRSPDDQKVDGRSPDSHKDQPPANP